MSFTIDKPGAEGMQPAGTQELPPGSANLHLSRSLRLHRGLAALVGGLVLAAVASYALLPKGQYVATSQVSVEPNTDRLRLNGESAGFDSVRYETLLAEQIELMQREDTIVAGLETLPQSIWAAYGGTEKVAAESLGRQLKVERVAASFQEAISLKGPDAAGTAAIVNAVTTAYLAAAHRATLADSDERVQLLSEEGQRVADELKSARAEQMALAASIGVANPTVVNGNPYDAELSGLRTQLIDARAAHDVAAAQLGTLSGTQNSGLAAAADEIIAGDAGISAMRASVSERRTQLEEQMSGLTPSNPVYEKDQEELGNLERTLDKATSEARARAARRVQDKLRVDLERTSAVETEMNGELARQIAKATGAAPRLQRATEVAGDLARLEARAAQVNDALRSLRLESAGRAQIRLSLAAAVPEHAEATRARTLLFAATPLALLCALAACVLAEKRLGRIFTGEDIQASIGFAPIAILPARDEVQDWVHEEYVLRLAASIESAHRTRGAKTFLMTPVSLTTDIAPLAAALARKMREIGVQVAVATAGQMLSPNDAQQDARAGQALARVEEIASHGFVSANIARLRSAQGLVLIESEPLVNSAQTEYVVRCVDVTILIVECGVTTQRELLGASQLLDRLNVKGIGAVLKDLRLEFADSQFRTAIEALNRRPATQTRPMRVTEPEEVMPTPGVAAEDTVVASQVLQAVDELHTVMEAPQPAIEEAVPVETSGAFALEDEATATVAVPEVAAETLLVGDVATERPVQVASIRREAGAVIAAGPVLVEAESLPLPQFWEGLDDEPAIAMANGTMHENIAPMHAAPRDVYASNGDSGMTRKTSWLGRLLGRDDAPNFSIIPDDDDATPEASPSSAARAAKRSSEPSDGYDIPLVSRLEQISRSRPAAVVPPPPLPASGSLKTAGLQIVPDVAAEEAVTEEPAADEIAPRDFSKIAFYQVVKPRAAVVEPDYRAPAYEGVVEEVAAPKFDQVSYEPEAAQLPARGPRRPLSFLELHEQSLQAARVAGVEQPAAVHELVQPESVAKIDQVRIAYEPLEAVAAPSEEPVALEPEHVEAQQAEPKYVEPVPPVESSIKKPAYAEAAKVASREQYDIQPVYEEASRHFTGRRWDPIPPLRSTGSGWRDRPAQVSASSYQPSSGSAFGYESPREPTGPQRRRWTGTDEEISLWTTLQLDGEAPRTEPPSERTLTRQWGLLSKFQQARASGLRSAAGAPASKDYDDRDANSTNGNGRF